MENKSPSKELKEKLCYVKKNGLLKADESTVNKANVYTKGYMNYLNAAKTEREAAKVAIEMAEANGFVPFEIGKEYKAGDKVYFNSRPL